MRFMYISSFAIALLLAWGCGDSSIGGSSDGAIVDAADDATVDAAVGDVVEGFGCCVAPDDPIEGCTLGLCAAGLGCYTVAGGPYSNHGVCCPGGSDCVETCDPDLCDPSGCQAGEQCNDGLTCRDVNGSGFCMP
jgi:hypothetical protein